MTAARIVGVGLLLLVGVVASVTIALSGLTLGLDFEGGARFAYEVQVPDGVDGQDVTSRARDVIASRLDAMGVSEASVVARGSSVSVELAGLDAEQFEGLRAVIGRTALLELVAVDDVWQMPESAPPGVDAESAGLMEGSEHFLVARGPGARERLRVALEGLTAPEGRRFALGSDARGAWRSYVLVQEGGLRGCIRNAEVFVDEQTGSPEVAVEYDDRGRERLAELTRRQRDRRIAIVLDGEVLSAPMVREPITGGHASIHLGAHRTYAAALAEANALVTALRAGALPAPILLESVSLISPAIAPATRLYAAVVALGAYLALAVVFALRYRAAGALWIVLGAPIATVTALAITSIVDATVSAPYCAGVALSVAWMLLTGALHFELARRVRHAWVGWVALLGAHASSFATAVVFFWLSSGPMRGLAAGLVLASPATALVAALGATSFARRAPRPATPASS